ncbi:DUF1428 domain-containing protein [Marinovum sp.]|uniref:DUF1428 domain-containing protein n=1 Tax=Marinovum sp. TaxID=2024839 RepID=UPI003A8EA04C
MYIEGLVIPVKKDRLEDYRIWAERLAQVFLDHGATRVVESVGHGLEQGKLTSFPRAVMLEDDEVAVFSWMEFPDKETRDTGMTAAFEDPRMGNTDDMPMDGKRIIFGGFETLVDRS